MSKHYFVNNKKFNATNKIIVSLSYPTKLPCPSYDLPSKECKTGSQLAKIKGTICSECYTFSSFHAMPKVQKVLYKRLRAISKYGLKWAAAMAYTINTMNLAYFRWHADGDLQDLTHLFLIAEVCWKTPNTKHWLATREWGIIRKYVEDAKQPIPPNLCIRLSGTYFDKGAPIELAKKWGVTCSGVTSNPRKKVGVCPASEKPIEVANFRHNIAYGHCGACRKCWDPNQLVVIYRKH